MSSFKARTFRFPPITALAQEEDLQQEAQIGSEIENV